MRDHVVDRISLPAREEGYPPFPPASDANGTEGDVFEAEPVAFIMRNDTVVCSGNGQGLLVASESRVEIFLHNENTCKFFLALSNESG